MAEGNNNSSFGLDWKMIIYDLYRRLRSENPNMEADYFVDICKIGALKRWEASQEEYAESSYKYFLERTNNQNFPFPKGVRRFFHNDEIFKTDLASTKQIKYIFSKLPPLSQ